MAEFRPGAWGADLDNTVDELSRTIARANNLLMALMAQHGVEGLSPSHGGILMQLFARQAMCMGSLARSIERDPSTVTALVRKLTALGYVQTARSQRSRREVLVSLTDKGRQLERDFFEISSHMDAVVRATVSEADLALVRRVLEALRQGYEEAERALVAEEESCAESASGIRESDAAHDRRE